ncbi:hypothetical protein pdam_00000085 [Pocillopora damicornis]|uniref:G-protein coupled receptors family 1 profile domain-containing protein n=1 Tax=Pocillopora damicornis TaxID=46731 RepID=A0A3M6UX19_POCDA|nr:hypothetical protein pdam_00000085 [Pocillopora damicornis]
MEAVFKLSSVGDLPHFMQQHVVDKCAVPQTSRCLIWLVRNGIFHRGPEKFQFAPKPKNRVATDLVVGTIMDPVSVAFHTSKGLQLNIVDIEILDILYFILCTASILILMALTVERYVAVSSPVKYKTMVTSKRAII